MEIPKLPFSLFRKSGDLVFLSGQIGLKDGRLVDGGVRPELRQAVENVKNILIGVNLTLQHVVAVEIFLIALKEDYASMNEVYAELFTPPYPARTCVGVKELPLGARIEIKVTASVGAREN